MKQECTVERRDTATCPSWCVADHTTDDPGCAVIHAGPTQTFGSDDQELTARLELVEGATNGSDGYLVYLAQSPTSDSLRLSDARALGAQLIAWAERVWS